MHYQKQRSCLFIILTLLAQSCFHKSDSTGTADDVLQTFTAHTAQGDYMITHEEIFHATSKSSGPGGSYTSGYRDFRYTVRDMQTGTQVTRLVTGDDDHDFFPICLAGDRLWCYSADNKTGLHARDPITMEIYVTENQLEQANPALAGNLNKPKLNEADQFFSYDLSRNSIILADIRGNLFSLDPASLKAKPIVKKPGSHNFDDAHGSVAYTLSGTEINVSGDPRKFIHLKGDIAGKESFLYGEILLEQNRNKLSAQAVYLTGLKDAGLQKKQDEYDSLLKAYPVFKDEREAYLSIHDVHLVNHFFSLQKTLQEDKENAGDDRDDILRDMRETALGGDSNTIYLMHADNLTDTAGLLISKISIRDHQTVLQWTTMIPKVYFDPSKGIQKNPMAEVFKAGNPEFDYEWYGTEGKVLTGIKMLFAFGINTDTGKLLWKVQL